MNKREAKKYAKRMLWYEVDRLKQSDDLMALSAKDQERICNALDEITRNFIN